MRFINMLLYRINKFFGAPLVLVAFLFICKGMTGMDLFAADPVASSSPGSDGPQDNLRFLFAVFFITWLAFLWMLSTTVYYLIYSSMNILKLYLRVYITQRKNLTAKMLS